MLTIDQAIRRNVLYFLESPTFALVTTPQACMRLYEQRILMCWQVVAAGPKLLKKMGMTPDDLSYVESQLARAGVTYADKPTGPLRNLLCFGHGLGESRKTLELFACQMMAQRRLKGIGEMTAFILDIQIDTALTKLKQEHARPLETIKIF